MAEATFVVGIDVGKYSHYVWAEDVPTREVLWRGVVSNTEADIARRLSALGEPGEGLVVVDQPRNIGAAVVRVATRLGFKVAFLPPDAMRKEADRQGVSSKTDRMDAMVICHAAFEAPKLLRGTRSDPMKEKVRALRARDTDLMHDEVRAKNRLRAMLSSQMPELEAILDANRLCCPLMLALLSRFGGPWSMKHHRRAVAGFIARFRGKAPAGLGEAILAVLDSVSIEPEGIAEVEAATVGATAQDLARIAEQRGELEDIIERLLQDDEDYENLLTMPGVGAKTAAAIVADVDVTLFKGPFKLARYMGVAPRVRRSSISVNKVWSDKRGNVRLRHAMFTSAAAAIVHDARSRAFYDRKRSEGKTHAAAILALARKRAKVIYAMLRDKRPYEERAWEAVTEGARAA